MSIRVGLYGNMANNAFNMLNILRRQGIDAQLVDDGIDLFAFSRPFWEECSLTMSYSEVMAANQTMEDWISLERLHRWKAGDRLVRPRQARTDLWHQLRRLFSYTSPRHSGTSADQTPTYFDDTDSNELLKAIGTSRAGTIEALRQFDVLLVFGFLPAACAFLSGRPTIYFTYGGDMRVELANRNGQYTAISNCFRQILASRQFMIEAYGCDREIHEILRRNGLLHKSSYAYLPNINLELFHQPWDREAARRALSWPVQPLIFFMPSRLDYEWKASDRFLSAYSAFATDKNDVMLVVTGWGRDYEASQEMLRQHGLSDRVIFLSQCYSKPKLFGLYAAADVIVDQFRVGSLGSVSYEALCMGKPVLTHVAPFNLMSYSEQPPVLNASTEKDIRDQLQFCYSHRDELEKAGQSSAEWYARTYSAENLAQSITHCVDHGAGRWVSYASFGKKDLPTHEIPVPNHHATIAVRPWPYPYRAGIAVSNDCEYYSWKDFCTVHQWLNSRADTPWGPGLGLPISDSFWFYSENPERLGFSYFDGTNHRRKSPTAPYISELLRAGILDTLHTYGGFDLEGSFQRHHAEAALEELEEIGVKPAVWTNHGNTNNRQNLGGFWFNPYQEGDLPDSYCYHTDLLLQSGFRYFWLDPYSTNRFSLGNRYGRGYRSGLATDDGSMWGDQLLCRDSLRDGQAIRAFRRFRGTSRWAPDPVTLSEQLSDQNLDHLEETGGGLVLYQHFGCRRDSEGQPYCRHGSPFQDSTRAQMTALARRYEDKRIWVAPTSKFLKYLDAVAELRIDIEERDEGVVLVLSGHSRALDEGDLAGVHLRVSGKATILAVEIQDERGRRAKCHYDTQATVDGELAISWPEPEFPEFPFTGDEIP